MKWSPGTSKSSFAASFDPFESDGLVSFSTWLATVCAAPVSYIQNDNIETGIDLTERQLIARVQAGDGDAERKLYEAYVDRVFGHAYSMKYWPRPTMKRQSLTLSG